MIVQDRKPIFHLSYVALCISVMIFTFFSLRICSGSVSVVKELPFLVPLNPDCPIQNLSLSTNCMLATFFDWRQNKTSVAGVGLMGKLIAYICVNHKPLQKWNMLAFMAY